MALLTSNHLSIGVRTLLTILSIVIPHLVPEILHQKDDLSYLCKASELPVSSSFHGTLHAFERASCTVIQDLASDTTIKKLSQLKKKHPWVEEETSVYFELVGDASHLFPDVLFICSKVHCSNGLLFNTIYFEGTIYVTIQETVGEQPLIDVSFPDLSAEGKGAVLSLYDDPDSPWMKLSIYQVKSPATSLPYRDKINVPPPIDEYDMDLTGIGDFSICSVASSRSENEHGLTTDIAAGLLNIIDDAMLDICKEFDDVIIDCGINGDAGKEHHSEQTRAAKLTMLEERLLEIRGREKG